MTRTMVSAMQVLADWGASPALAGAQSKTVTPGKELPVASVEVLAETAQGLVERKAAARAAGELDYEELIVHRVKMNYGMKNQVTCRVTVFSPPPY